MNDFINKLSKIHKGSIETSENEYPVIYDEEIKEQLQNLSLEELRNLAIKSGFEHYFIPDIEKYTDDSWREGLIDSMSDISDQPEHVTKRIRKILGL
jgi:uncharacterized membrane-anchored protein